MSRPVGNTTSSPVEISFDDVDGEQFEAPRAKGDQPGNAKVEPWSGKQLLTFEEPVLRGPGASGSDLAAQSAREAAQRRTHLAAVAQLEAPLHQLASKYPDPISFFGNTEFKTRDVALGAFGDVLRDPAFTSAAANLSQSEVRAVVSAQVKKAWPHATPEEADQLRKYFMRQAGESLRENAAPRLQKVATEFLEDAAQSFDKVAADQKALAELAQRLSNMVELSDVPDLNSPADLKAALGLDPTRSDVSPEELSRALKGRAALLHQEARKMANHDRPTLFRALTEQEVGGLYKQANGIREGSFLSAQIDAVKAEGESEKQTIAHVKLASMVTAGVAVHLLGIGALAVSAAGLPFTSVGVAEAWGAVDAAKAGESAGTRKAGAAEDARRLAVIETGVAVASTGAAGVINHALHGVAESVAGEVITHIAVEVGVEKTLAAGGHALDHALSTAGGPTGKSALERAGELSIP